jgi:hypothetical protein
MNNSISYEDVIRELVHRAGTPASAAVQEWRRRHGFQKVVAFVEAFEHSVLFQLRPGDITAVIGHTEHALGNVKKEMKIRSIEDFHCPFALQHLFHRCIERIGHIPTWQEYWSWMERQAAPYWLDPLNVSLKATGHQYQPDQITAAIRWRLGNFYYSAVREIDLLVWLRARGLPVRYHVLADVLLRVDLWLRDFLVCAYVSNEVYRQGSQGRKRSVSEFFHAAQPPFRVLHFTAERHGFGKLWLISEQSKRSLANQLERG